MTDKATLRAQARDRRAHAFETVDPAPALDMLSAELAKTTGPISFYWPIRTEIDPSPLMEGLAATRPVCLPVTHGREAPLTFRAWQPGAAMETDGFGVSVPAVDDEMTPEVLIVPMLAFDPNLHRLGYGAGHYDRTFAKLRPAGPIFAIGFAYEAQRTGPLPVEPTDQALDLIVTEERVHRPA